MFRPFYRGRRISPIEFIILLQLRRRPMYGYEVLKALREEFKDVWEPKTGTLYPALRRLEAKGFIKTELKEERELYTLTEKGRELLKGAVQYLEEGLEFADKYYRFVSMGLLPLLRDEFMERMKRLYERGGCLHLFPLLFISKGLKVEDKGMRLKMLKKLRELIQMQLQIVNERIREIEGEGETKELGGR